MRQEWNEKTAPYNPDMLVHLLTRRLKSGTKLPIPSSDRQHIAFHLLLHVLCSFKIYVSSYVSLTVTCTLFFHKNAVLSCRRLFHADSIWLWAIRDNIDHQPPPFTNPKKATSIPLLGPLLRTKLKMSNCIKFKTLLLQLNDECKFESENSVGLQTYSAALIWDKENFHVLSSLKIVPLFSKMHSDYKAKRVTTVVKRHTYSNFKKLHLEGDR